MIESQRSWVKLCNQYDAETQLLYRESREVEQAQEKMDISLDEYHKWNNEYDRKLMDIEKRFFTEDVKSDLMKLKDDLLFQELVQNANRLDPKWILERLRHALDHLEPISEYGPAFSDYEKTYETWGGRLRTAAVWEILSENRDYYLPSKRLLGLSRALIDRIYDRLTGELERAPTAVEFAQQFGWTRRQFENVRPRLNHKFITEWDARRTDRSRDRVSS